MLKQMMISATLVSLYIGMAPAAQAAPTSVLGTHVSSSETSQIEKAAYRCWWAYGHRHCRHVHEYGYRGYGPGYGYGPGVGLYYGGRGYGGYGYAYRGYGGGYRW